MRSFLAKQRIKFASGQIINRTLSAASTSSVSVANPGKAVLQTRRSTSAISEFLKMTYRTTSTASAGPGTENTKIDSGALFAQDTSQQEDVDDYSVKFLLFKDNDDEILQRLNRTSAPMELVELLKQYENQGVNLERQHRVQSIILLRHFALNAQEASSNILADIESVSHTLLNGLRPHIVQMDLNELSCCYLYLRRFHVPNTEPVMQELLMEALHKVNTSQRELPLPALSRLTIAINIGREFFTPLVCKNFMPHILQHVDICNTADDARLLAICYQQLQPLIDEEMLERFKDRVQHLLQKGEINSKSERTILKVLHMLNLMPWSMQNSVLLRNLLLTLRESLLDLSPNDLKFVCRVFQYHFEPASLLDPLKRTAQQLLQQQMSPDTLSCFMSLVEPSKRDQLVQKCRDLINAEASWQELNASGSFFNILRSLKIADINLCNKYWDRVVQEIDENPETVRHLYFLRHCHRYMNFNNNLGGTYRHAQVEKKLSHLAMSAIDKDLAGRLPDKFARLAAFVLAYGHTPYSWKKFPNIILSKIINMADQFSIEELFLLSRGLHIALEMRYRHSVPSLVAMQLSTIDSVFIDTIERHLTRSLTASDLVLILRTLGYRKSLKNTSAYQKAFNTFKEINYKGINSRIVRDLTYIFSASNYLIPEALEAMFNYVEDNHQHVMGETVEKVLNCAYNLGYVPKSEVVLDYANLILMRDFDYMSGLSIVQACLALCYYKSISTELIDKVFCVKFIQRIEEEIQLCYSKATYPERVLNLVMQLNRTVCLDFPEANVPWFQQNYLEAQLSKRPLGHSLFKEHVKALLAALLKDESYFRCNHTTPYGYQIDFVIHFDRDKKPMPAPAETTMLDRITKVAILLLKLDSFCENDLTALRGPESLKIKHLEMMGYKVLHINEHDWNSKYLNAPGAKANYLKCLLQISN